MIFTIWRKLLPIVWAVILIHFLKDITQDVFHLSTYLDIFGNIEEDVGWLPPWIQGIVYGAGLGSFVIEIFLLISLPLVMRRKQFSVLEGWICGCIIFLLMYFPVVLFLDPRMK